MPLKMISEMFVTVFQKEKERIDLFVTSILFVTFLSTLSRSSVCGSLVCGRGGRN